MPERRTSWCSYCGTGISDDREHGRTCPNHPDNQRRNSGRAPGRFGLCDIGDCESEHEWSLTIETTVPGRVAWNAVRVCTEHVERVQEMQAMFARGDRSYLTPVAEFDHDTREWVPITGDQPVQDEGDR